MDALLLARLQFALTVGFHFLFPPTTFALTLVIVYYEWKYFRTGNDFFKNISAFFCKLLALVFVFGTATWIFLEFSFGNNWSEYSKFVADVFAAPLAAEIIFAFFLESVFIGVLVFARERVSRGFYFLSSILVFFGAHLSGFWILAANSWMQTPAGYRLEEGKIVLTDFWEALFNHSTLIRFIHTTLAGWITGSLLIISIAAYFTLKKKNLSATHSVLRVALVIFFVSSFLQIFSGHQHSVQVARTQPLKMAAFEGLFQTQSRAPLSLFAIPDQKNRKNHFFIGIPGLLSFLIHFDLNAEVSGLDKFPEADWPPLGITFFSYHIMIMLGFFFVLLALILLFLVLKNRFESSRFWQKLCIILFPLGYIACQTGWIAAEVGRQPWIVYNLMRTSEGVSKVVSAQALALSLSAFILLYVFLGFVFVKYFLKIVKKGIDQ